MRGQLLRLADVVTPNLLEALALVGATETPPASESWEKTLTRMRKAAKILHDLGAKALVVTGGDLQEANDYVSFSENGTVTEQVLAGCRIESKATHGTGCAFATAIACRLARGAKIIDAMRDAKEYVREGMLAAYPLGKGVGPMNHLYRVGE